MIVRTSLLSLVLLGIGYSLGTIAAQNNGKSPRPDKQRQEEIDKLIGQLKSDQFKVREEATRQLMQRDDALPALQKAVRTEDAEIRRRAQLALDAINKRLAKRALQRAIAMLKKGRTDQFVDQLVPLRDYVDEDCWKAAVAHVQAIADEASKVSGGQFKLARKVRRPNLLPWVDIAKLQFMPCAKRKTPDDGFIRGERIVAGSVTSATFIHDSFVICTGSVQTSAYLGRCVVFANGNLRIGDQKFLGGIGDCIVVCDGDVTVAASVGNSVILATGNVSVGASVENSAIVSGGDVRTGLEFKGAPIKNSLIQEHQRDPLNFIHFFDPAQVGIEVTASRNQVQVEGVAAAKPFARAGVRRGDQVVAVDGVKVASAEAFRRLLRQRLQKASLTVLDIRREGKPLRIEVRVSDSSP